MPRSTFEDEYTQPSYQMTRYDFGEGVQRNPHSYISTSLSNHVFIRFGGSASFERNDQTNDDEIDDHYDLQQSSLESLEYSAAFSYAFSDRLSVGSGFDLRSTNQSFGQTHDMFGDGFSASYNLGLVYQAYDDTDITISYRSSLYQPNQNGFAPGQSQNASTDQIAVGLNHDVNKDISLFGQFNWQFMDDDTSDSAHVGAPSMDVAAPLSVPAFSAASDNEDDQSFSYALDGSYRFSQDLKFNVFGADT